MSDEELVRLIVKAFKERELLKIGNRSYVNAFRYPESRFDFKDLMPNGGSLQVLKSDMLQPLRDPGKILTDQVIIPPSKLVFLLNGRAYVKCGLPQTAGQISGGLTNHRKVVQENAIDALPTDGGAIFMKSGNYSFDSACVIAKHRTHILGEGADATVIEALTSDVFSLNLPPGADFLDRCRFADLTVRSWLNGGNGISSLAFPDERKWLRFLSIERVNFRDFVGSGRWGLLLKNSLWCMVRFCFFHNMGAGCVKLTGQGSDSIEISFNTFNPYNANTVAVDIAPDVGFSDVWLERNTYTVPPGTSGTIAVRARPGTFEIKNIQCRSEHIEHFATAFDFNVTTTPRLIDSIIENCRFGESDINFQTLVKLGTETRNIKVLNNIIWGSSALTLTGIDDDCAADPSNVVRGNLFVAGQISTPLAYTDYTRFSGNQNWRTESSGTILLPDGASSVTQLHYLAAAPSYVDAIPLSDLGGLSWYIANRTATSFDLKTNAAVAGDKYFRYVASVRNPDRW